MIPVIMAGGSGTRLWPLSRSAYPKQFLKLGGEHTMLQQVFGRLQNLNCEPAIVITGEEHRFLVAEQLRQIGQSAQILLEPIGRNTAPAIALAAFQALSDSPAEPPVLLILASDHVIKDTAAFEQSVLDLLPYVQSGKFGTLGVVADRPATGYGYIKSAGSKEVSTVLQFVEKPDHENAVKYLKSGEYLWNSGMFMIRADRYLAELERCSPEIYKCCAEAMQHTSADLDFVRVGSEAFDRCPSDSIDYALMEPLCAESNQAVVVAPLDAGWSDVGDWSALWEVLPRNTEGNAILHETEQASGEVINLHTSDTLVVGSERAIVTLGVKDLVIVDTKDAVLIAHKDHVQSVKDVVAHLKQSGSTQHELHREVYRPWGKYDSIDSGERYQVKRITVKPGAKLSVQMHHHRAEHWIVVSGTAQVTNGEKTFLVTENESTYIPIGQVHCLENPGKVSLEMIEVQSGSYLGEDDIVRLKDQYGRV